MSKNKVENQGQKKRGEINYINHEDQYIRIVVKYLINL